MGGWESMREAFEWHKVKPSAQGVYFGGKKDRDDCRKS